MIRKTVIILLIITVVIAFLSLAGGFREKKEDQKLANMIAQFAGAQQALSFDQTETLEKKIAAYKEKAVPELQQALNDGAGLEGLQAQLIRGGAARTLGRIKDPSAVKALEAALAARDDTESNSYLLASLLHGAGLQEMASAELLVTEIIADKNRSILVRQQAVIALGRIAKGRKANVLIERFRTDRIEIMKGVVAAFHSMENADAPARLLDAYLARRAEGAEKRRLSLKILNDLLDLIVAKTTGDNDPVPGLRDHLSEMIAWPWLREEVDLNSLSSAEQVGPVTAAELLTSLCLADTIAGHGHDAMARLIARAASDPRTVSQSVLPEAIARFFERMVRYAESDPRATVVNTAAKATIEALVTRLGHQQKSVRLLAYRGLKAIGQNHYPFDPAENPAQRASRVAVYTKWWNETRDSFRLWTMERHQ